MIQTFVAFILTLQAQAIGPSTLTVDSVIAQSEASAAAFDTCTYSYVAIERTPGEPERTYRGTISQRGPDCVASLDDHVKNGRTGELKPVHERVILRENTVVHDYPAAMFLEETRFVPGEMSLHAGGALSAVVGQAPYPLKELVAGDSRTLLSTMRAKFKTKQWTLDTSTFAANGIVVVQMRNKDGKVRYDYALDSKLGYLVTRMNLYDDDGKVRGESAIEYDAKPGGGITHPVPKRYVDRGPSYSKSYAFADWRAAGPDEASLKTESLMTPNRILSVANADKTRGGTFQLLNGTLAPVDLNSPEGHALHLRSLSDLGVKLPAAATATTAPAALQPSVVASTPRRKPAAPPPQVNDGGQGMIASITTVSNPFAWIFGIAAAIGVALCVAVYLQRRAAKV